MFKKKSERRLIRLNKAIVNYFATGSEAYLFLYLFSVFFFILGLILMFVNLVNYAYS